jgi:transaldolase
MPPATFEAFRDHGRVRPTLEADLDGARGALAELAQLGISMDQITDKLLVEAIRLFQEPFAKLLAAIEARRGEGVGMNAPA